MRQLADMPHGMAGPALAAHGSNLYLFGGHCNSEYPAALYQLDVLSDGAQWKIVVRCCTSVFLAVV
jgi:hypothetical protein